MFDSTHNAVRALDEALRCLEPEVLSGAEARAALADVIPGERLCAAAKVALAAWIDRSGAYQGTTLVAYAAPSALWANANDGSR